MKIALLDDDKKQLNIIYKYIAERLGSAHTISTFTDEEKFLSEWKAGDFDLILIDIFMDKLLGIDVARKIRQTDDNVKLVFCTSSNEFAQESYDVKASYYLRKPITKSKIEAMLKRVDFDELELLQSLRLPDGQNIILRNITYAEYDKYKIVIHNKKGDDITSRILFSEAEAALCDFTYFCTCSKGIIVNFYHVRQQNKDTFLMDDNSKVPISRRRQKEVADAYASFRFDQLRKEGDF